MKRLVLLMVLLVVITTGCSTVNVDGEWGKANKDGIQAQLYSSNKEWIRGEPNELRFKLKNSSNESQSFSSKPYLTLRMSKNGNVFGEHIGEIKVSEKDIILEPGKVKEFLLVKYDPVKEGSGNYEFLGSLDGVELPAFKVIVK